MMSAMASPGIVRVRKACLGAFGLVLALSACGPPHVVVRTEDHDATVPADAEEMTGGTGGTLPRDAAAGGTGGMVPRDAAPDVAPVKPDVAPDVALPPDLRPDSAPDAGPEVGGQTILLVMGFTTPKDAALKPGDAKMKARLEMRGYKVVMGDDDDADASKATGAALVIITETVGAQVGAKYTNLTIPVICADNTLFDDLKMTANGATDHGTADVTQIAITDMAHPIAGGMMGAVTIIGAKGGATWGKPSDMGQKVATIPGQAAQTALFGYPKGAMMSGLAAPAKRAGFFVTEELAVGMNEMGWKLFDAVVDWSLQ
jgi:hypothetical protein